MKGQNEIGIIQLNFKLVDYSKIFQNEVLPASLKSRSAIKGEYFFYLRHKIS